MQNSPLYESYLKKQTSAIASIKEHTSPKNRTKNFKHFEAVSKPVTQQKENTQLYLSNLRKQFKETLRKYVHQDQSFKSTIKDLFSESQKIRKEKQVLQNQLNTKEISKDDLQIQKELLTDKNEKLLQRILTIQEQNKSANCRNQQYLKMATCFEEDIQYQKCVNSQFVQKNKQLIEKLQTRAVQIEQKTFQLQTLESQGRKKQSQIKEHEESIQNAYTTLSNQDNYLQNLCIDLRQGLQTQNQLINKIQSFKNDYELLQQKIARKSKDLEKQQETYDNLKNTEEDLYFQLRQVNMETQIQEKGIEEECWKVNQEKQRLIENSEYLAALKNYLSELVTKNEILQTSLQEQIIQDYTVKKIVDSKCYQPVGKKTKQAYFAQNSQIIDQYQAQTPYQSKENFFKSESKYIKQHQNQYRKPYQLQFQTSGMSNSNVNKQAYTKYSFLEDTQARTGFTYIDNLTQI